MRRTGGALGPHVGGTGGVQVVGPPVGTIRSHLPLEVRGLLMGVRRAIVAIAATAHMRLGGESLARLGRSSWLPTGPV